MSICNMRKNNGRLRINVISLTLANTIQLLNIKK